MSPSPQAGQFDRPAPREQWRHCSATQLSIYQYRTEIGCVLHNSHPGKTKGQASTRQDPAGEVILEAQHMLIQGSSTFRSRHPHQSSAVDKLYEVWGGPQSQDWLRQSWALLQVAPDFWGLLWTSPLPPAVQSPPLIVIRREKRQFVHEPNLRTCTRCL